LEWGLLKYLDISVPVTWLITAQVATLSVSLFSLPTTFLGAFFTMLTALPLRSLMHLQIYFQLSTHPLSGTEFLTGTEIPQQISWPTILSPKNLMEITFIT
jgi:hypothetical protein